MQAWQDEPDFPQDEGKPHDLAPHKQLDLRLMNHGDHF